MLYKNRTLEADSKDECLEIIARTNFEIFLQTVNIVHAYSNQRIKSVDNFAIPYTWLPIIQKLIEKLIEAGWNQEITDVKEKSGLLRFYIGSGTDKLYELISEAEKEMDDLNVDFIGIENIDEVE